MCIRDRFRVDRAPPVFRTVRILDKTNRVVPSRHHPIAHGHHTSKHSNLLGEVTSSTAIDIRLRVVQLRTLPHALGLGSFVESLELRTAGMEGASGRRSGWGGKTTLQQDAMTVMLSGRIRHRNSRQQTLGVGMHRVVKNLRNLAELHNSS